MYLQVAAIGDPWSATVNNALQPYSHIQTPPSIAPHTNTPLPAFININPSATNAHASLPPPLPPPGVVTSLSPALHDSYGGSDIRNTSIAALRLKAREHSAAMELFTAYGHIK